MTGFGRSEATLGGRHIIVEIKSVNHKFLEFSLRISKGFGFLEDKLKTCVQKRVSRGKVDMYVHIENLEDNDVQVMVNHSLVQGYVAAFREISERYGLQDEPSLKLLAKNQDVFSIHRKPEDEDSVFATVKSVLEPALDSFIAMREKEGERLYNDIMSRTETIMALVNKIEVRSPDTENEYRQKLENKLRELLQDRNIDEQRILTETAIFADKIAVDEETVRLKSHFNQMKGFASASDAIGRKMDFLAQEMNREINTIGSKASDAEIAYMVVDIKSEIEKIREQIQNIE
ncbi:MAG: YicC/YloC family endoribonuclease [Oscillospiraceae bacterium]